MNSEAATSEDYSRNLKLKENDNGLNNPKELRA